MKGGVIIRAGKREEDRLATIYIDNSEASVNLGCDRRGTESKGNTGINGWSSPDIFTTQELLKVLQNMCFCMFILTSLPTISLNNCMP